MGRPHIEFIQAFDVAEEAIAEGPFAGTRRRLLSEDDESGAWTCLLSFPADWSGSLEGYGRPVEAFVLSGELSLDGAPLGPSIYGFAPSGQSPALAAIEETLAIVMADDEGDAPDGEVAIVDPGDVAWAPIGAESGMPPGIVYKPLRIDEERGDWSYMVACAPYWQSHQAEVHPTVQEGFTLRGDVLDGDFGIMGRGDYFWRPGMVPHGPMFSHHGGLFFFRTKGGSWELELSDVPEWKAMVEEYKNREPFFTIP